jgi:hypothetical protein
MIIAPESLIPGLTKSRGPTLPIAPRAVTPRLFEPPYILRIGFLQPKNQIYIIELPL